MHRETNTAHLHCPTGPTAGGNNKDTYVKLTNSEAIMFLKNHSRELFLGHFSFNAPFKNSMLGSDILKIACIENIGTIKSVINKSYWRIIDSTIYHPH